MLAIVCDVPVSALSRVKHRQHSLYACTTMGPRRIAFLKRLSSTPCKHIRSLHSYQLAFSAREAGLSRAGA